MMSLMQPCCCLVSTMSSTPYIHKPSPSECYCASLHGPLNTHANANLLGHNALLKVDHLQVAAELEFGW